jgi:FkbM family methyltransferase
MAAWAALKRILDRPGGRLLLGLLMSFRLTVKLRRFTLVWWEEGTWVHRWRGAAIPNPVVGAAPPPETLTAEARDIFLYGYVPQPGNIVFDVGAGIGETSLLFSWLVGNSGRVVAIEAHPQTFERLQHLCRLNRLDNVTPLHLAASDREGEVSISDDDDYITNTILRQGGSTTRVTSRSLDDVADELGIDQIDLLKMNIEGAERPALVGMANILTRTGHVCVGCHDFLADGGGSDEFRTKDFCRRLLVAHGFVVTSRGDATEPWVRDYLYGAREP